MPGKAHGRQARVYAAGYDLSGSSSALDLASTIELADATVFGAAAKGYLVGLRLGKVAQKAFFDDTVGAISPMLSAVRDATTAVATFWPAGDGGQANQGYGSATAELLGGYKLTSPVGGATVLAADWEIAGGLEDVVALLAKGQVTGTGAAVTTTVLDNGASSAAGASAYFHITQVGAGTVSAYKVQHSADNATWADLLTSGLAGNAVGADRQATAATATINRYVRVGYTLTNAVTATLAVAFHRG